MNWKSMLPHTCPTSVVAHRNNVSNNDDLAELAAIVSVGDVRGLDKFLAPPADALHNFLPKTGNSFADEHHDVKEAKPKSNDSAPSQSFLRRLFALFLNVFYTSSRTIVVVIELAQC